MAGQARSPDASGVRGTSPLRGRSRLRRVYDFLAHELPPWAGPGGRARARTESGPGAAQDGAQRPPLTSMIAPVV